MRLPWEQEAAAATADRLRKKKERRRWCLRRRRDDKKVIMTAAHCLPPVCRLFDHVMSRGTVGYFVVPYQINTFYPMFYGNIYLFGTWGLSINIWMTNFDEGALWLLV